MSWKQLDSRTIYENPWMEVREDHVINPGGGRNHYGYIHFKNRAIAILPLDDEGNTWLVGQQRYTLGEYSWELPMGGAPRSEPPETAALRELKEETGLRAARLRQILKVHTSNSVTDEEGYVFLAEGLTAGEPEFDETEQLEIRRLPFSEAVAMATDGRITDGISVAGILALARELRL